MKKAILTLLAIAVCAICFVSCNKNNTTTVYVRYTTTITHTDESILDLPFVSDQVQKDMNNAIAGAVKVENGASVESEANDNAAKAACDKVYAQRGSLTIKKPFTIELIKGYLGDADSDKSKTLATYEYKK